MYDAIKNFNEQFAYEPEIINQENLVQKKSFTVVGMGGSNQASGLIKMWNPDIDIITHHHYGLPQIALEELKNRLIILSSYSGNTEETIDAFLEAKDKGLAIAVIAVGGKLLELAREQKIAYVELPNTGIQPRAALGFSVKAMLALIGEEKGLEEITKLAESLRPLDYEEEGKALAERLKGFVPVVYSSYPDLFIAMIWKIKFNETGKIPSFYHVFSEMNHNEMTGFDIKPSTKELSSKFYFIILKDVKDDERVLKRMEVLEKLYKDRGLPVENFELKGDGVWHKIFSVLLVADWASYYIARGYGLDPEQVPMVEEFKKLII